MNEQKETLDDDEAEDRGKGGKSSGRRKPAYAGGLVLDPKKGKKLKVIGHSKKLKKLNILLEKSTV